MHELQWLALAMLPATLLSGAIHEAGHVLAGAACGFSFAWVRVGPFWLRQEDRRWRLRFQPVSLLSFDGASRVAPHRLGFSRSRAIALVAGGPLLSLICAGLALLAYRWPFDGHPFLRALLLDFSLISLAASLLSLMPFNAGPRLTDGYMLRELATTAARARRFWNWLHVSAQWTDGVLPRDWDHAALASACSLADGSQFEARVRQLAYYAALDRDENDEARLHLQRVQQLRSRLPAESTLLLDLDIAWFDAAVDGRPEVARTRLDQARTQVHGWLRVVVRIVETAVTLTEGRIDDARDSARQTREILDLMRWRPLAATEFDWLESHHPVLRDSAGGDNLC